MPAYFTPMAGDYSILWGHKMRIDIFILTSFARADIMTPTPSHAPLFDGRVLDWLTIIMSHWEHSKNTATPGQAAKFYWRAVTRPE